MEIYEMKYFLEVARFESLSRASKSLSISSASLSRAVSRLEEELGVALFFKDGRNIKLSVNGKKLQSKVSQIVQLEEDARLDLGAGESALNIEIMAEEALHQSFSFEIFNELSEIYTGSKVHMLVAASNRVIQSVKQGDVMLGIIAMPIPKDLTGKKLGTMNFNIYASSSHPLAKARTKQTLGAILEEDFAITGHAIFGIENESSVDNWDDHKYPRKIKYKICSLNALREIVSSGEAICYLPDFLGDRFGLKKLSVERLPKKSYPINLISRSKTDLGWVNSLF